MDGMDGGTDRRTMGGDDQGPVVFAVTTATLTLATVFVGSRMICRIGILRKVGPDDYVMALAWLLAFSLSLSMVLATRKGLGRHDVDIDEGDRVALRMLEYLMSVLYSPALMAIKSSVLIFYLRLARNTRKFLRLASWVVLVVVNAAGLSLTFLNVFRCQPMQASWDYSTRTVTCIPLLTEFICSAPVNIITDVAILALPIPVLTGMRLPPRQKTILVITFAVGIFVAAVDVVRITYLQKALDTPSPAEDAFGHTPDFMWKSSLSLMWSVVEVNVAVTCACVPTLKPLVIRILPAMLFGPEESHGPSTDIGAKREASKGSRRASRLDPQSSSPVVPAVARLHGGKVDVAHPARKRRHKRHRRAATRAEGAVYFAFFNLKRPKSMLQTEGYEALGYCAIVTILFLLWGFSHGLLNTLNTMVAKAAEMTTVETLGLTSAYFGGGYFFGPLLVGKWILRHDEPKRRGRANTDDAVGDFKTIFIAGLLIYGIGTVMFWPSAVLTAFPGFLVSSFVVGFGLAVLETAANPFLALCGPARYAEARLCVAQGVQGVGSVLSNVLADRVYVDSMNNHKNGSSTPLVNLQWTYLAITLLCVILALFFYYMPLPEVADVDLDHAARRLPVDPGKKILAGLSLRTWSIGLAVVAQWTYVGAQECTSVYLDDLIVLPGTLSMSVYNYKAVARSALAISRFMAGLFAYLHVQQPQNRLLPPPRIILAVSAFLSVIFMLLLVVLKRNRPDALAVPLVLYYFAEGPLWPLIFATALRGQGLRTKRAAAWLTMGASGPAFWPFVQYAIISAGGSIQTAFVVVLALLLVTLAYPLFLTLARDARLMVDPLATASTTTTTTTTKTTAGAAREGKRPLGHSHVPPDDEDVALADHLILAARKRLRIQQQAYHPRDDALSSNTPYAVLSTTGSLRRCTLSTFPPIVEHVHHDEGDGNGEQTQPWARRNTWAGPL